MVAIVNTLVMLTSVNTIVMLTSVNAFPMSKSISSATVGTLVRQARLAAGLSQTELGRRIGASRFWVAQFERGKPSAELGLALRAMNALGLTVRIEATSEASDAHRGRQPASHRALAEPGLADVIAHATLTNVTPSAVIGWPTASERPGRSRRSRTS